MWMLIALVSIAVLAAVGWVIRTVSRLPVCPVCVGVAGTWGWMFVAHAAGYAVDMTVVALLMGGTPVGIAYVLEKKLPEGRLTAWWKLLAIPAGIALMYGLLSVRILWISGGAAAWLVIAAAFFRTASGGGGGDRVRRFEKGLDHCC